MVIQAIAQAALEPSNRYSSNSENHVVQELWQSLSAMSWGRRALGVMSAITILATGSWAGSALASEPPVQPPVLSAASSTVKPLLPVSEGLAEGMYLYGDSSQSGVVGHNYLVFQVTPDHRVVGAAYAPFSSFDCFQGHERSMNLELMIRDSYTQNQSAASIPLSGLQQISALSATDQNLLKSCQDMKSKSVEASRVIER